MSIPGTAVPTTLAAPYFHCKPAADIEISSIITSRDLSSLALSI